MLITRKFKKDFQYRNLGGTKITLEFELTKEEIAREAISGNWACYNFIERRKDFNWIANKKFYYGKGEDNLGYVVCSDELEG